MPAVSCSVWLLECSAIMHPALPPVLASRVKLAQGPVGMEGVVTGGPMMGGLKVMSCSEGVAECLVLFPLVSNMRSGGGRQRRAAVSRGGSMSGRSAAGLSVSTTLL